MSPNPNVLFELGYAVQSVGWDNIIMVQNTFYGGPQVLPFDIKGRRTLTYKMGPEDEHVEARKTLQRSLHGALSGILKKPRTSASFQELLSAIENQEPRRLLLLSNFLKETVETIDSLRPTSIEKLTSSTTVSELETSLELSIPTIKNFHQVCNTVSEIKDLEAARKVYEFFGHIYSRYSPITDEEKRCYWEADYDFDRFLGYELFLAFASPFVVSNHLEILQELLNSDIYLEIERSNRSKVSFGEISEKHAGRLRTYTESLDNPLRTDSPMGDLIRLRHNKGGPLEDSPTFLDAIIVDYFLFVVTDIMRKHHWFPQMAPFLQRRQTPRFLSDALQNNGAERLCVLWGLESHEQLRNGLKESADFLCQNYNTSIRGGLFGDFPYEQIGTQ